MESQNSRVHIIPTPKRMQSKFALLTGLCQKKLFIKHCIGQDSNGQVGVKPLKSLSSLIFRESATTESIIRHTLLSSHSQKTKRVFLLFRSSLKTHQTTPER